MTVGNTLFLALALGVFVKDYDGTEDGAVELFEFIRAIFGAVGGAFGEVQVALGVGDLF